LPPPPTAEPTPEPTPEETPEPTPEPTPSPIPVTALACDITFPNNFSGTANHWIPNTGDKLDSLAIKLTATGAANEIVPLTETRADIALLTPIDQNFVDPPDANNTNLYRNRGTAHFIFYAHSVGNNDYHVVSSFDENQAATVETDSFTSPSLEFGENKGLRVDENGNLYYYEGETRYTRFAIAVDPNVGIIRPGDDMELRFALMDDRNKVTTTNRINFLAVYDKKMMWRAQSYLDERPRDANGNLTGGASSDWNDSNPWTAAQDNDWDSNGNGGQFTIRPWTLPHDPDSEYFDTYPITTINNSVPYSWGCLDSPQDVNDDLDSQRGCLNIERGNWITTLAPDNDWRNYSNTVRIANGVTYNPYRPVLTSIMDHHGDYYDYNTPYDDGPSTAAAIGVDCSGFVQRVASYSGNTYTIRDTSWTGEIGENRLLWSQYHSNVKINGTSFYNGSWRVYDATAEAGDINLIIPGDIITMDFHMVLVCKVVYQNSNNRILVPANVLVIEAASPDDQWQVLKKNTRHLSYFAGEDWTHQVQHVEVRRLIIN
jgi:hypothetical protein